MRKNILALSIATMVGGLGFAGVASANVIPAATGVNNIAGLPTAPTAANLAVNTDGTGHILVVPYFTVQNGNATLINIVNTDPTFGKAVKIRFRGAANSDDVFDFQIFMSPGDVFAGKISKAADGRAQFETTDTTCTLPKSVNRPFVLDRLPTTLSAEARAAQTNEGYVEIFNMGDIPRGRYTNPQAGLSSITGVDPLTNPLYAATKHAGGVAPCNSTNPVTAAEAAAVLSRTSVDPLVHNDTPATDNAATQGLALPTSGLMANWTIVNVPGTNTWTGAATAILGITTGPNPVAGVGNLVMHPQTNANAPLPERRTSDPILAGGFDAMTNAGIGTIVHLAPVVANMFDFPDLSTPYVTSAVPINSAVGAKVQAAAITGALSVTSVTNEFLTNSAITAKTDWVFSSPTRRYSVGVDYAPTGTLKNRVFAQIGGVPSAADTWFYDGNTEYNTSLSQVCVLNVTPSARDREETTAVAVTDFVISPGAPGEKLSFCGEVSVVSYNNTGTSVLGAKIARKDVDIGYKDGWVSIATPGNGRGLPILGASFESAFNPVATTGVSGNYGLTFSHRYTR